VNLFIYLFIYLYIYIFIYLFIYLFVCLFSCIFIYIPDDDWHEVKRKKPPTPKQLTGLENTDQEELDFQFDEELENQGIKPSSSTYWYEISHNKHYLTATL